MFHKLHTVRNASFLKKKKKSYICYFSALKKQNSLQVSPEEEKAVQLFAAGFHSDMPRKTKPTGLQRVSGHRTFIQEITKVEGSWCYFCDGTELSGVTPTALLSSHFHRLANRDPSRVVEVKTHSKVLLVTEARQPVASLLLPALHGPGSSTKITQGS